MKNLWPFILLRYIISNLSPTIGGQFTAWPTMPRARLCLKRITKALSELWKVPKT